MNQAIIENLKIFDDFIQSEDWVHLNSIRKENPEIDVFLTDIMLMFDSVEFFTSRDSGRAVHESNLLSSRICDFLGYI
mgnify:CR=1 FL=1